jgi:hypothetical protein
MNTEKKITKRDNFTSIVEVLENAGRTDLADVVRHEIDLLDAKASKAKERAATKKAEADELMVLVQDALTSELTTIANITAGIEYEGISPAKVQARLNKLVANEVAVKEQISVGEGKEKRKLMAYKLA